MKYVGVILGFNNTLFTDTTHFSVGKIYRAKFDEDDLGPLDYVKSSQIVLVDTGRGFFAGRIVRRSSSGFSEEDVTLQVIDLLYTK